MKTLTGLAASAVLSVATSLPAMAADLKVGFISSMSGPVSALGIPYAKGIQAAVALHPEVAGRKVQLIMLDDASDPTTAARNARKLVTEAEMRAWNPSWRRATRAWRRRGRSFRSR